MSYSGGRKSVSWQVCNYVRYFFFFFISNEAGDTDFILTQDRDQENKNQTMNIKLYGHKTLKQQEQCKH